MKICNTCKLDKELAEFGKDSSRKDGVYPVCKLCKSLRDKQDYLKNREKRLTQARDYYEENKQEILSNRDKEVQKIKCKQYRQNNKEKVAETNRAYKEANKEQIKVKQKEYRINNRDRLRERKNSNPVLKLAALMRKRVGEFLRFKSVKKQKTLIEYLGCSPEHLKIHLESLFTEGMSWENQGQWHIDHIIPLASAQTEEEIYRLNHYTNLQPLWAIDNLKKSSKIK